MVELKEEWNILNWEPDELWKCTLASWLVVAHDNQWVEVNGVCAWDGQGGHQLPWRLHLPRGSGVRGQRSAGQAAAPTSFSFTAVASASAFSLLPSSPSAAHCCSTRPASSASMRTDSSRLGTPTT